MPHAGKPPAGPFGNLTLRGGNAQVLRENGVKDAGRPDFPGLPVGQGKFVLFHDEKADHVHEHVHDNGDVNVDVHVLVDVAVDGCCFIRR